MFLLAAAADHVNPTDVAPWLTITIICAAMFIVGLGKAGFGGGIGIVVTPLMAMVISPSPRVLAVTLPAFVVGDICSIACHPRNYHWPLLKQLLPTAVVGVILGSLALRLMQISFADHQHILNNILALLIGSVSLCIILMQLYRLTGRTAPQMPCGTVATITVGIFEAFLSTLTNSAGVLMALLLLQMKLSKQHYMTTVLTYFLVVNAGKFIAFITFNRIITADTLAFIAPYLAIVPVGCLAGVWLNRRIDAKLFTLILYFLAAATASRMIVKVLL